MFLQQQKKFYKFWKLAWRIVNGWWFFNTFIIDQKILSKRLSNINYRFESNLTQLYIYLFQNTLSKIGERFFCKNFPSFTQTNFTMTIWFASTKYIKWILSDNVCIRIMQTLCLSAELKTHRRAKSLNFFRTTGISLS